MREVGHITGGVGWGGIQEHTMVCARHIGLSVPMCSETPSHDTGFECYWRAVAAPHVRVASDPSASRRLCLRAVWNCDVGAFAVWPSQVA